MLILDFLILRQYKHLSSIFRLPSTLYEAGLIRSLRIAQYY